MATQRWAAAEPAASEAEIATVATGAGGPITIADADVLFSAEYVRIGDDLVLRGADGVQIVLTDYFLADPPPALIASNGAMLLPDTLAALTLGHPPIQLAQAGTDDLQLAQAGPPIGQVETLTGTAQAIRNGVTVQINVGDQVFQGDVVQTGPGSALGITFVDGTVFRLSAGARMVLDQMVYDPGGSNNSMFFDLVQGTFVFVTGQVAPTGDMRIVICPP